MSGVIVLASSVCLCVCLSVCLLPFSWPNVQTYGLEFRHVGQVEGYLGQVRRSRSYGQRNVPWAVSLTSESLGPAKEETGESMTWGVFKSYAFFLLGKTHTH